MPVPSPRNKILPARGLYADLFAATGDLVEGEICYALDEDQYYQKEGGVLVAVGASKAQGALADSALQPGDNISKLSNDAGYITSAGAPVQPEDIPTVPSAVSAFTNDAGYITSAEAPVQPGDIPSIPSDVSAFNNDAGYITAGDIPADVVTSVQGRTGDVTVTATDLSLENVDNTSDSDKPVSTATQTALDGKADLVGGIIPTSQIPAIAITEFLGDAADQAAMLALSGQKGDWCNRQDVGMSFIITGEDPSVLASWTDLVYPAAPVTSVNGQTGTIVLDHSDVGAATTAQGATADSATQPGDNVSTLNNDANYITSAQAPVQPGDIPTNVSELTNDSNYATVSQIPTDNSSLSNGANYITLSEVPSVSVPVQSVNSKTGNVTLNAGDVGAVAKSGDNMTGGLTLGTDKIKLNSNGSIEAAAGNFNVYDTGEVRVNTDKVILKPDGSASLAGVCEAEHFKSVVTGTDSGLYLYKDGGSNANAINISPTTSGGDITIRLAYDGSATFNSTVTSDYDGNGTSNTYCFVGKSKYLGASTTTSTIATDGTITATGYSLANLTQL